MGLGSVVGVGVAMGRMVGLLGSTRLGLINPLGCGFKRDLELLVC